MKCPKCGSENTFIILPEKVNAKCRDCNELWSEKKRYQQRLDKILNKFEDRMNNKYCLVYRGVDFLGYTKDKNDKPFYIIKLKLWVSLETVESLLKDLESEKNETS